MVDLYDVNALIALLDENHEKHEPVSDWFFANAGEGWASCPLTQNGFLRIVSQERYRNRISLPDALGILRNGVSSPLHRFIADDISLLDDALVDTGRISGHGQLTDIYLLALAVAHDARFVTLDTRIPRYAVMGATPEHLVEIQSL